MDKRLLDIYSDYLICSFSQTTATGLSSLLEGALSHDKITRFLSGSEFTSADLWQLVKPLVRQIEREDAVLVIDDSIEEKLYTDESELICWHWDHCFGRSVKGVNFLSCLYRTEEAALPVAFQLIQKSEWTTDKKTGKQKRVCPQTKNDYFREMVAQCQKNQLPFRYVLADSWFSAADNMVYLKNERRTDFVFPLKENRKVALSQRQVSGDLPIGFLGATRSERDPGGLAGEGGLPSSVVTAGLYKQRRQSGRSLSGHERYDLEFRYYPDNLPETVESGRVSQVG